MQIESAMQREPTIIAAWFTHNGKVSITIRELVTAAQIKDEDIYMRYRRSCASLEAIRTGTMRVFSLRYRNDTLLTFRVLLPDRVIMILSEKSRNTKKNKQYIAEFLFARLGIDVMMEEDENARGR